MGVAIDKKGGFFSIQGSTTLFEKVPFQKIVSTLLSLIFYNVFDNWGRKIEIRKGET